MVECYYNILGVNETASQDEIKKAYRALSLKWHPDKNNEPDAIGKFQKINEAYENLGDEQKRVEYDALRRNPFHRPGSKRESGAGFMPSDMDNIFQAFFGGGGGGFGQHFNVFNGGAGGPIHFVQQGLTKPTPIVKNVTISLDHVFNGVNLPLEIDRWIVEGNSQVFEKETVYVTIPKGIDDGEIIILREKGNVINEQNKGDIKIFIKVEPTQTYQRRGLDLFMTHKISLKDALCGFTMELKHINGRVYTLNNNTGTIIQPDYKKIIPNMGLMRDDCVGSLILSFTVDFPQTLTPEQIKILREVL